jgi:hypothetical protein
MMTLRKLGLGLVLAAPLTITACGGGSQAQTQPVFVPDPPKAETVDPSKMVNGVTLQKNVWDDYQAYRAKMNGIGGGWYAVTEDGTGGGGWACPEALCEQSFDGKSAALKSCQAANPGKTCVIFAKNDVIQMKYDVAQ